MMTNQEAKRFYIALRLAGFEDRAFYHPKGNTGECFSKYIGRFLLKDGSVTNANSCMFIEENLIEFMPIQCFGYIENEVRTLCIHRYCWQDAGLGFTESTIQFTSDQDFLNYVLNELIASSFSHALKATSSLDVSFLS